MKRHELGITTSSPLGLPEARSVLASPSTVAADGLQPSGERPHSLTRNRYVHRTEALTMDAASRVRSNPFRRPRPNAVYARLDCRVGFAPCRAFAVRTGRRTLGAVVPITWFSPGPLWPGTAGTPWPGPRSRTGAEMAQRRGELFLSGFRPRHGGFDGFRPVAAERRGHRRLKGQGRCWGGWSTRDSPSSRTGACRFMRCNRSNAQ